jgi:hypothetical protein
LKSLGNLGTHPAEASEGGEHEVKRYRVLGLYQKDPEPNNLLCSAYVLVTDSTPAEEDVVRFVEVDIAEAMEAFQQGRIDLFEVPPKYNWKRSRGAA